MGHQDETGGIAATLREIWADYARAQFIRGPSVVRLTEDEADRFDAGLTALEYAATCADEGRICAAFEFADRALAQLRELVDVHDLRTVIARIDAAAATEAAS